MEFQMGLRPSTTPSFELCDNSHFLQRTWNTQARKYYYYSHTYLTCLYVPISNGYKQNPLYAFILGVENIVSISCPINGEYTGVLPDAPNFCAKMSSDCNSPNIMFYSVSGCSETAGIYDGKNMTLR